MPPESLATHPELIETVADLDEVLTRPTPALVELIRTLPSPLVVLGAGGKMGPTLCVLARRASEAAGKPLQVVAVSRFGERTARDWLESRGVRTLTCDLLDAAQVRQLPDAANVIYLVGLKFGTSSNPAPTWAVNTLVPAQVAERYAAARVVALSTGNVYPLSAVARGGALESAALTPLGEYSNAAVARERIFEFESSRRGVRVALIRLFYACELRYGVLADLARKIHQGDAIDITNGHFNAIWQGDANELALRSLDLATSPPSVWNLCRPELFSVLDVAARLGDLCGKEPRYLGKTAENALIGHAAKIVARLGQPGTGLDSMLRWIAHWVAIGGHDLRKPTHFEVRDGQY